MTKKVRIQLGERRITVDGSPVQLRAKSFDVLALLASRPGHLFAREVLIDRVWRGRAISPDVLTGCIREIRRVVGDSRRSPEWIETVSGSGYRLLQAPLIVSSGAEAEQLSGTMNEVQDVPAATASVAVLPFSTLDSDRTAIGQALSRDIAVGLARTRWLRIAASASAERLPPGTSPDQAAEKLGVRYLLSGDLRWGRDKIALQIALIEGKSRDILWGDQIERPGDDVASLMAEVCAIVVASAESEIEAAERRQALLAPVSGVDAWVAFHRGMSFLQRQEEACLDAADQSLRSAARADPTCARIAAARSWHCWQQLFFGRVNSRDREVSRAREFAQESIALDPRDPLGHWALGRSDWLVGELESAAESLQRSVELNPSFATAHYSLGYTFYLLGRESESMVSCDNAIRLSPMDPLAFAFHCIKAHVLCFDGQTERAAYHARCVANHPNVHGFALAVAAWVQELCGNHDAARHYLGHIRRRWPGYSRADYVTALLHQSPWYPKDRRRAIERAFDRLDFF